MKIRLTLDVKYKVQNTRHGTTGLHDKCIFLRNNCYYTSSSAFTLIVVVLSYLCSYTNSTAVLN